MQVPPVGFQPTGSVRCHAHTTSPTGSTSVRRYARTRLHRREVRICRMSRISLFAVALSFVVAQNSLGISVCRVAQRIEATTNCGPVSSSPERHRPTDARGHPRVLVTSVGLFTPLAQPRLMPMLLLT